MADPGAPGRAAALRALHRPGEPLVLVNAWDAASARVVAATPGCAAIATASYSIAAARGVDDGEAMPLVTMLAAVGEIARAVALPVTADLEAGYGDAGATVAAAIEAGAVGCNLEDGVRETELRPVGEHADSIAAARAAGEAAGVPVVINARTDVYLAGAGAPEERAGLALERGRAYLQAGADCIFVPGVRAPADIERLVGELGSVSVLATAGGPSLGELARLGVARVSVGPGSLGVAMAALRDAAAAMLAGGELPATLAFRP